MENKNPPNNFPLKLNIAMHQVPLKALDPKSQAIVCDGLNQNIVRTSENGIIRNYRGLAELTRCYEYDEIQTFTQSENPTGALLACWQDVPGTTIGKLLDLLIELQRFDILDDLAPSLTSRGRAFLRFLSEEEPPSPEATEIEQLAETIGLKFVSRASWHAFQPLRRTRMVVCPTRVVFIHHSVFLQEDLQKTVQSLQSCKIIYYGHDDLDYNFLVGEDGTVFEGRGWDTCGSHTRYYNYLAISFGLLGNFEENVPDPRMLDAVLKCIDLGITLGKIHPKYGIYPHCDASDTQSPGRFTLEAISSWPRFRALGPLPSTEKLREMNTWDDLNVESSSTENLERTEKIDSGRNDENLTLKTEASASFDSVRSEVSATVGSETSDFTRSEANDGLKCEAGEAIEGGATDATRSEASDTLRTMESNAIKTEEKDVFKTEEIDSGQNKGNDNRIEKHITTHDKVNTKNTTACYPAVFDNVYNELARLNI